MRYTSIFIQAVLGFILLSGMNPAKAGSFGLNPVRMNLSARQTVDAIKVTNQGDEAVVVQLEPLAWTKAEGKDVYNPTSDLIAAPPIFTVPPKGSQVIRIGLRRAPDPARELAYRVFFQEVPPPPKPGFRGLQVALRMGIPVYVAPTSGQQSQGTR